MKIGNDISGDKVTLNFEDLRHVAAMAVYEKRCLVERSLSEIQQSFHPRRDISHAKFYSAELETAARDLHKAMEVYAIIEAATMESIFGGGKTIKLYNCPAKNVETFVSDNTEKE